MTAEHSLLPRFGLAVLFRVQTGLAGMVAVCVHVSSLGSGWASAYIAIVAYLIATSVAAFVGYAAARAFFGRAAGVLLSMAFAAIASCFFGRPKIDDPREFAILGAIVSVSLVIAFGWLDSADESMEEDASDRSADGARSS